MATNIWVKLPVEPTHIPEFTSDPINPCPETAWVLKNTPNIVGSPIGLLLALTYTANITTTYQFSYKTLEGPIVRTTLT